MSGKVYSGEKAVISLTSWKKRIDNVGLTLFSLLKQCPGFHIVLVLSEEEFPKKEAELPASLMAFVNAKKIELLWVGPNLKSFKKILPVCEAYPNVPIISADDDCIYIRNYAQELYDGWKQNTDSVITNHGMSYNGLYITRGISTLFPPHYCTHISEMCDLAYKHQLVNDDAAYMVYNQSHNIRVIDLNSEPVAVYQHQIAPLSQNGYILDNELALWYEMFIKHPLISSDCISGHLYKDLNLQYPHPFMWTVIKPIDMLKLIAGWGKLDFHKICITKSDCLNDKYVEYKANIANEIDVHFIHIKQSPSDKTPRKVAGTKYGGDVYIDNPPKLILDQYTTRLARMQAKGESPIFLINENPVWGYTTEVVNYMMSIGFPNLYCISDKNAPQYITVPTNEINNFNAGRTLRLYFKAKEQLIGLLID